jgi:hypothetical protein
MPVQVFQLAALVRGLRHRLVGYGNSGALREREDLFARLGMIVMEGLAVRP